VTRRDLEPEMPVCEDGRKTAGRCPLSGLALLVSLTAVTSAAAREPLLFNRDVRPILADKCWHCHGPDVGARQADLRLDQEDAAHAERDGRRIIHSGRPAESELIRRITATNRDERMPPVDQERQLTAAEIELLRRWIEEGGSYQPHWALIPQQRPPLPEVWGLGWARNPIDYFVLERLEAEGLQPAPPATRETLLRRVTLDLTGLPPTPSEVEAFLNDDAPHAYERTVDRLLQSPAYGERMALVWLDAARFADSGGYQGDILRSMWLWRDGVIAACNQGQPFDQFTIEQLAGDLLPDPTQDQLIATGFNRNHRINDEDGIIHEEFRVEYVVDRVETTSTVWMGLTLGCARCHDHKYDPISQREFYQFFAYFNSINESGRGHGNAPPLLHLMSPQLERRLADTDAQLEALRQRLHQAKTPSDAERTELTQALEDLQKQRAALLNEAPTTMVMEELAAPRETFVLVRGAYNQPSEKVAPGTPVALGPAPAGPGNRLGLARWLLNPEHPLTARVAVNRYWQMYFGAGLVDTPEDFGSQGSLPSHPALLDWLATEFVRSGWDVKAMQRLIVTSATYQQAARVSPELLARDPANRLLARGPRFRLPAETIRDQALAASGLLVLRLGGPSVRPYQPEGLWSELVSASLDYEQAQGADLYRRSLYTFIRRTISPPAMAALDAPNREICTVRRPRTNTPLQALNQMNDPTYVEAARHLAARALREGGADEASRLAWAFRLVLARKPQADELATLRASYAHYRTRFQRDPESAQKLLSVGASGAMADLEVADHAAGTAVAMLILNLDEAVTKE